MIKPLKEIIGDTAVEVLRDKYIYQRAREGYPENHGLTQAEIKMMTNKVSKELVYARRQLTYTLTARKAMFDEKDLERLVWKEFLQEQMGQGKNTGQISIEIGRELGVVNSYV